jgi:hypothetical protein
MNSAVLFMDPTNLSDLATCWKQAHHVLPCILSTDVMAGWYNSGIAKGGLIK